MTVPAAPMNHLLASLFEASHVNFGIRRRCRQGGIARFDLLDQCVEPLGFSLVMNLQIRTSLLQLLQQSGFQNRWFGVLDLFRDCLAVHFGVGLCRAEARRVVCDGGGQRAGRLGLYRPSSLIPILLRAAQRFLRSRTLQPLSRVCLVNCRRR